MSQADLIPGVEITLGTSKYILPPAGLDVLIEHGDFMRSVLSGAKEVDIFAAEDANKVADVIHATLRMNYPDLDRSVVTRGLNLTNAGRYFSAAVVQSFPVPPAELQSGKKEGSGTGESIGVASSAT